ncbi:MAG: universal stress protein [Methanotrichaceae archaeon]|nr:universal stress protein [Methanotrichaceae archaeon]
MFENILIAVDGLKHSQRAEDVGIGLAKVSKGKVTALNVTDIGSEYKMGEISGNIADEIVEGNKKYIIETENERQRTESSVNCK